MVTVVTPASHVWPPQWTPLSGIITNHEIQCEKRLTVNWVPEMDGTGAIWNSVVVGDCALRWDDWTWEEKKRQNVFIFLLSLIPGLQSTCSCTYSRPAFVPDVWLHLRAASFNNVFKVHQVVSWIIFTVCAETDQWSFSWDDGRAADELWHSGETQTSWVGSKM